MRVALVLLLLAGCSENMIGGPIAQDAGTPATGADAAIVVDAAPGALDAAAIGEDRGPHDDAGLGDASTAGLDAATDAGGGSDSGPTASAGRTMFTQQIEPMITAECGACHLGRRFAFASLVPSDHETNYQTFLDQISLDAPRQSRLLAKMLSDSDPSGMLHAGGKVADLDDATYSQFLAWIELERTERCPTCGARAPVAYVAYVEQPQAFWALARDPIRRDHGLRDRSRIMLQPIDAQTMVPAGNPIDFLGNTFCGQDGRCDFGHLSASYAGDRLVFECRLSLTGADWVNDVRWNVCIAEIGPDGHAINPRFLMPPERIHSGRTIARSDPFGLTGPGGDPLKGVYDMHFWVRGREDTHPVFSPDDSRIYLASRGPDPRTGVSATQTYHGSAHLNHIIAVKIDGSDPRTIYLNEGGEADFPFFLKNGNVAFHTWNLERMDRHLYTQSHADGMMEIPALLGRLQGPNMWGKAVQLAGGGVLGMTGRRRSAIDNYVPFFADHTLGTSIEPTLPGMEILDRPVFDQIQDFPTGYCGPPSLQNCVVDHFYADPAYAPDGGALIAHNPEQTYVLQAEDLYLAYSSGDTEQARIASLSPYLPTRMGIWRIDHRGQLTPLFEPRMGTIDRYPTWVGVRQAPRVQPWTADESLHTAELHIADVPIWLSFSYQNDGVAKAGHMATLDRVVALRVLTKELGGNACLNDARPYRYAVNNGAYDHPTHLGINNATGFSRLGSDVPLEADRSIRLTLPSGRPLLFQGIDAEGHAVVQRSRLLTLPPGTRADASVPRAQYASQCGSCHGSIDASAFVPLTGTDHVPLVPLDYGVTLAASHAPVDLAAAPSRPATFLHVIRPLLDRSCVSCHSGASPAGELSLEATYSATANYPAGRWANTPGLMDPNYLAFVPTDRRVPGYNYSTSFAWTFREDEQEYRTDPAYAGHIAAHDPLADRAPWDPAYQNLYVNDGNRFVYLGGYYNSNFGRSDRLNGISSDSWLIEILSGRDLDPTRSFTGPDHTGYLSAAEVRDVMAVLDVGFPFMARCDDRTVPSGPNAGQPWGEPEVR